MTDGQTIGRYRLLERVGRGGMGVVWRGIDPVLDREVAVKVMTSDFLDDGDDAKDRFFREARAAARLQHRNIVTIFEFAEDNGVPYIVMEFLRGQALGERMKGGPPLTLDEKLDIVAELCAGLQFAHDNGVIHRDVKPPNVWLLEDGKVKLLDFGIARMASSTLTRTGDVLGSASYMAPEQVMGQAVDGRADIFSTAVVLYELLGGRRPFDGDAPTATLLRIMHEDAEPLDSMVSGLPPALIAAVNKGLQKNPEDRYQTAGEFGSDLQLIRMSLGSDGPPVDLPSDTRTIVRTAVRTSPVTGTSTRRTPTPPQDAPVTTVERQSNSTPKIVAGAVAAALVLGLGWFAFSRTSSRGATTTNSASGAAAGTPSQPPVPATLQVTSDPDGAAIVVDGRDTGRTTPAAVPLGGVAPNEIRLTKEGFQPLIESVTQAALGQGAVSYRLLPAEKIMVQVSAKGPYPFEVLEGQRVISPAASSHDFTVASPTSLRLRAAAYLLDQTVKVDASEGRSMKLQAPELGQLTIRSTRETCKIFANGHDLGFPPVNSRATAAGNYRLELKCPGGQTVQGNTVQVLAGQSLQARVP